MRYLYSTDHTGKSIRAEVIDDQQKYLLVHRNREFLVSKRTRKERGRSRQWLEETPELRKEYNNQFDAAVHEIEKEIEELSRAIERLDKRGTKHKSEQRKL